MAWRIDEAVIRGEIDNRSRGRVVGRIWFVGRAEPVELDLKGDCWRDLAGRRLEFTNPEPKPDLPEGFVARQEGAVGDITASRKVKVPDIPLDQIGEYYAQKKPWPWHWGNSLYLEWYSEPNGRVVIESAGYELKIVGEAAWEMTPEEDLKQRQANGEAIGGFMERLGEAMAAESGDSEADPAEWDEKPFTEEEAEKMQEQSDRLVDRIEARMRREGVSADYAQILHEEIERARRERGEPDPTPEQLARNAEWIDEMNRAAEAALDDPSVHEEIARKHPLAARAFDLSLRLIDETAARGWLPADASEEHPVVELVNATMKAGAKLAGALNSIDWPPEVAFCAGVVVRLKRARSYLGDAVGAAESCAEQNLTDFAWLAGIRSEVDSIAGETDALIAELRTRLGRGFD
jgi:hypothetical protein